MAAFGREFPALCRSELRPMGLDGPDCVSQLRERADEIESAQVTQILPFLYVGNQHDAKDLVSLKVRSTSPIPPSFPPHCYPNSARPNSACDVDMNVTRRIPADLHSSPSVVAGDDHVPPNCEAGLFRRRQDWKFLEGSLVVRLCLCVCGVRCRVRAAVAAVLLLPLSGCRVV